MQVAVVAGARQFERFPGKNEARDDEEDVHHGPSVVEGADEGQLNGRRGSRVRGVDAVVGEDGRHEVGVVVQEDGERRDTAEAVEIRRGVGPGRFVQVRCQAPGDRVRKQCCRDSFDDPDQSARHRRPARAMTARYWGNHIRLLPQEPLPQLRIFVDGRRRAQERPERASEMPH